MGTQLKVVAYKDGWDVIYADAKYAESHHATRIDAIAAGIEQACRDCVTLVIFDQEGRECSRRSYSRAGILA